MRGRSEATRLRHPSLQYATLAGTLPLARRAPQYLHCGESCCSFALLR